MLVLSRSDVEALLDLDALVDAVARAMSDLSAGEASVPARVAAVTPRGAALMAMPAYVPAPEALVAKLISVFPDNADRPTHQSLVCCFHPGTGTPIALMDGQQVTAARTAAGSVLATRLLAADGARVATVIGSGVQARSHARAMAAQAGVDTVLIAARDRGRAEALAADLTRTAAVEIQAASTIEAGVRAADVVCAATHAREPVVRREWLREGAHINSVGYNAAGEGEVDGDTVRDALVVVESRAAALAPPPAGAVELRLALERGLIQSDHVAAEIGEVLLGRASGRTREGQITLYKSVGVAAEDAAAAGLVLGAALGRGVGTMIEI